MSLVVKLLILYYTIFNNTGAFPDNVEAVLACVSGVHFNQYANLSSVEEKKEKWLADIEQTGCTSVDEEQLLWSCNCSEAELLEALQSKGYTIERNEKIDNWVLTNISGISKKDILEGYEIVEDLPSDFDPEEAMKIDLSELLGDLQLNLSDII